MADLAIYRRSQSSSTIKVLCPYFAGNEDEDDGGTACPTLAWINFATAGVIMSSSWASGFFACSTTASC